MWGNGTKNNHHQLFTIQCFLWQNIKILNGKVRQCKLCSKGTALFQSGIFYMFTHWYLNKISQLYFRQWNCHLPSGPVSILFPIWHVYRTWLQWVELKKWAHQTCPVEVHSMSQRNVHKRCNTQQQAVVSLYLKNLSITPFLQILM